LARGLTGRDVTVEAHRDVYEKEIDAFVRYSPFVSMQKRIGNLAVQSRATAGGVAQANLSVRAARIRRVPAKDAWTRILVKQPITAIAL